MTDLYVTMTDLERQRDQARHELRVTTQSQSGMHSKPKGTS